MAPTNILCLGIDFIADFGILCAQQEKSHKNPGSLKQEPSVVSVLEGHSSWRMPCWSLKHFDCIAFIMKLGIQLHFHILGVEK